MNVFELLAKLSLDSSDYDKGLDKAKGLASSVGNGIAGAMKVGIAAVGAASTAVVGFVGKAVEVGKGFDTSMAQVYATMGDKANEVVTYNGQVMKSSEALRDFAQVMGRETKFTASEAADALNYMALAGYDAQMSMKMLPNVLNLAAAGAMDLARASDMVTDTQTAFGISSVRTSEMVAEMAKAASTGNTNVEQLGDAFLVVGGLAQELNGGMVKLADGTQAPVDNVQELEIALTAMANAGIKGSEAGTHMRNMLLKLSSPTDAGTQALEAMGVTIFDLEGNMRSLKDIFLDLGDAMSTMTQEQKIGVIADLFNTRDIASAEALLNAVGEDWNAIGAEILKAQEAGVQYMGQVYTMEEAQELFGDEIYNSAAGFKILNAAEKMALDQQDTLAGSMTSLGSAFEGLQLAISDEVSPALRRFVDLGTNGLRQIVSAFKAGGIDSAMGAFTRILEQGLTMVNDMLPDAISAGMKLLGAIGQGIINNIPQIVDAATQIVVMLANGLVQALPKLAKGAITLVESLRESFKKNAPELMSVGTELLNMLITGLTEGVPEMLTFATDMLMSLVNYISENATEMANTAADIIQAIVNGLSENLPTLLEGAAQLIISLATALTDPNTLGPLLEGAVTLILALADGLIQALPQLIEAIPVIIQNLVDGIVENLPMIVDGAIALIGALAQAIIENLPLLLAAAVQIITTLVSGLIEALPTLLMAGYNLMTELIGSLIESFPKFLENGAKLIGAIIEGMLSEVESLIKAAIDLVTQFIGAIKGRFTRIRDAGKEAIDTFKSGIMQKIEDAKNWGADLISNFIGGIKEKWENLKDTVADVAGSVKDLLGFSEPKLGPLSNFHTYAPDMMNLFAQGIKDNKQMLLDTVADAFNFQDLIVTPTLATAEGVTASTDFGYNQVVNIYSPTALDPSETARQTRNATRDMILQLRGKR